MRVITRQSFEPCRREAATPRVDVAVLFDVFRASTTLTALMAKKPKAVVATNDEAEARRLVDSGYRLVSEVFRGGLDNSPTQVLAASLAGEKVVHKSTNLTAALFPLVAVADRVLVGAFVNLTRLTEVIAACGAQTIELVAAGHFAQARPAVEDTAAIDMVARWLAGDRRREIPNLSGIRTYLDDRRRRRPDGAAHFWDDATMALSVDRLPHVAEARLRPDGLIDMIEVT